MGVLFQVIGTVVLCFSCMNMGILCAWPSSTMLLFKSENTTLHRPMTVTEVAMLGSLPSIGSLIGNPFAAFILDSLGRKRTTMLTALIFVVAWSIIALTNQVEVILTTLVFAGCGCALFLQASLYISEISQNSIRGTMTACPSQFFFSGFLVSYFLGGALGYHAMVYACLSLAVAGVLMIAVLKESPVTLMAKGREEEAARSIAFYRRTQATSREVVTELKNIRLILNTGSEDAQSLTQVPEALEKKVEKKMSNWQLFKTIPLIRRQFYLIITLKAANISQGLPVVQVYAEPMFAAAVGDVMSPNFCSVLLGIVVLISGIVAACLTDVVGRRPLLIYSSIASSICCVVLGVQIMTECFPKWTIPLFIYVYAMLCTLGVGTVPFVILAEIFLPEVKSILSMLGVEWAWIVYFFALFNFNLVVQSVGLGPLFFVFSFVCVLTAVYCFYFVPETKGLPVHAIQPLFMKKDEKGKENEHCSSLACGK